MVPILRCTLWFSFSSRITEGSISPLTYIYLILKSEKRKYYFQNNELRFYKQEDI